MDAPTTAESSENVPCPTCGATIGREQLIPVGETQVCPGCREDYLGRLKSGLTGEAGSDAEDIRQTHIKHEASVKSVGFLYLLGGVLFLVMGVFMAPVIFAGGQATGSETPFLAAIIALYAGLGVLSIFLARGLRKLQRWVRIPVTILSALGLLSFPIGTIINGYIIWLIWSEKGKMVFTDEYQEIIAATPHVKYKTSIVVWVLLGLLILFLAAALIIPAVASL